MNRRNRPRQLRLTLRADVILEAIEDALFCLEMNAVPEYVTPTQGTPPLQARIGQGSPLRWREMTKDDLDRYKLILNTQFKLLDKCLPDLKAVAVQETVEAKGGRLDYRELAMKLRGVLAMTDAAGKTH